MLKLKAWDEYGRAKNIVKTNFLPSPIHNMANMQNSFCYAFVMNVEKHIGRSETYFPLGLKSHQQN